MSNDLMDTHGTFTSQRSSHSVLVAWWHGALGCDVTYTWLGDYSVSCACRTPLPLCPMPCSARHIQGSLRLNGQRPCMAFYPHTKTTASIATSGVPGSLPRSCLSLGSCFDEVRLWHAVSHKLELLLLRLASGEEAVGSGIPLATARANDVVVLLHRCEWDRSASILYRG